MPREDTQFKPGQSGNPNGRPPKGQALTDLLRERLEEQSVETTDGKKITGKRAVVDKLFSMALGGDRDALKYIWDRIDGKPIAIVEQTVHNETLADMLAGIDDESPEET